MFTKWTETAKSLTSVIAQVFVTLRSFPFKIKTICPHLFGCSCYCLTFYSSYKCMAEQLTNCACSALHQTLLSTSLLRLRGHVEKEAEILKAEGWMETAVQCFPFPRYRSSCGCLYKIRTGDISNNEWGGAAAVPPQLRTYWQLMSTEARVTEVWPLLSCPWLSESGCSG